MKTAQEYILYKVGTKSFERSIQLNDIESIKDFMNEFASHYANAKLDQAADRADVIDDCVERKTILSLKDKI